MLLVLYLCIIKAYVAFVFNFRDQINHNFLPFSIAISEYKVQLLINIVFNSTFEKGLLTVLIGNALILEALLLGSTIIGFVKLPLNVILNCLLGCMFALAAIKYGMEAGGFLRSTALEVKKLLWLGHLQVKSHNIRTKITLKERKRILKSCLELRIQVVGNQHLKNSSYVQFLDAVLNQTVNYSVLLQES